MASKRRGGGCEAGLQGAGHADVQGPQGIGKTSWVQALVTDAELRDSVVKIDHHVIGFGLITGGVIPITFRRYNLAPPPKNAHCRKADRRVLG